MKKILSFLMIMLFITAVPQTVFSQEYDPGCDCVPNPGGDVSDVNPDPGGDPDTPVPLDTHVWILMAGGLVAGVKMTYDHKRKAFA